MMKVMKNAFAWKAQSSMTMLVSSYIPTLKKKYRLWVLKTGRIRNQLVTLIG